jgi:hypothetical protein
VYEYVTSPYLQELVVFLSSTPYEVTCKNEFLYTKLVSILISSSYLIAFLTFLLTYSSRILRTIPTLLSMAIMLHYLSQSRMFIHFITTK